MRKLPLVPLAALALFSISVLAQEEPMAPPPDAKQQAAAKTFAAKSNAAKPATTAKPKPPVAKTAPLLPLNEVSVVTTPLP